MRSDPAESKLNLARSNKISEIQCATRENEIAFRWIQEVIRQISDAIWEVQYMSVVIHKGILIHRLRRLHSLEPKPGVNV